MELAFPKLFDGTSLKEDPPLETKWLGEAIVPPLGTKFRAQSSDGLAWAGEFYTVTHKGIAYYWLSWCPRTTSTSSRTSSPRSARSSRSSI